MAVDAKVLDDISEKIASGIKMLGGVKMGAEAQIQNIVEGALAHFDVVTHERMVKTCKLWKRESPSLKNS